MAKDKIIVNLFSILLIIAICLLGAYSIACTSQSPESTRTQELTIFQEKPSHNFTPETVIDDYRYWNSSWEAQELLNTIYRTAKSYFEQHTYAENVWDCSDMSEDIWYSLKLKQISSVIVAGNLELGKVSFAESNHVWLLVVHRDKNSNFRIYAIESTNGEIYPVNKGIPNPYLQGYYYSSPTELRADARERW